MNTSLHVIPSATPSRQQTDLKTFLGTYSPLEQMYKPPCSWNQKLVSPGWQPAATWRGGPGTE